FARVEAAGERTGKRFLLHLRTEMLRPGENVAYVEAVLGKKAGDGRLDNRKARARQDGGHAAENLLIIDLRLREVGDLRRAADVGSRGQKRVLHHWAQQCAGAERFRRFLHGGGELLAREFGVARSEFSVAAAQRLAAPA